MDGLRLRQLLLAVQACASCLWTKESALRALCTPLQARRPKVINTINYHLQRISRLMK